MALVTIWLALVTIWLALVRFWVRLVMFLGWFVMLVWIQSCLFLWMKYLVEFKLKLSVLMLSFYY